MRVSTDQRQPGVTQEYHPEVAALPTPAAPSGPKRDKGAIRDEPDGDEFIARRSSSGLTKAPQSFVEA